MENFKFKTKIIDNKEYVLVQDLKLLKGEYDNAISEHCRALSEEEDLMLAKMNIQLQKMNDKDRALVNSAQVRYKEEKKKRKFAEKQWVKFQLENKKLKKQLGKL